MTEHNEVVLFFDLIIETLRSEIVLNKQTKLDDLISLNQPLSIGDFDKIARIFSYKKECLELFVPTVPFVPAVPMVRGCVCGGRICCCTDRAPFANKKVIYWNCDVKAYTESSTFERIEIPYNNLKPSILDVNRNIIIKMITFPDDIQVKYLYFGAPYNFWVTYP
jgi:hypothetical protein